MRALKALDVKAEQAAYWRFKRQMPVVAIEAMSEDVLVISKSRQVFIVEVKISASDMTADARKSKHSDYRKVLGLSLLSHQRESYHVDPMKYGFIPNYFYFAVPKSLEEKARKIRDEMYPYAGIITVSERDYYIPGSLSDVAIRAEKIHSKKASFKRISIIVKAQSASLANIYGHHADLVRRADGVSIPEQKG